MLPERDAKFLRKLVSASALAKEVVEVQREMTVAAVAMVRLGWSTSHLCCIYSLLELEC